MNSAIRSESTSLGKFQLNFPTLPHTFLRAMELSRDVENINIDEVVRVVQNDLSAVTRILRVVNSAYHGVRTEINSLRRAIVVLGPEVVLGIVMSMSLIDLSTNLNVMTTVPFLNLVRHSIATAFVGRHFVSKSNLSHSPGIDRQELLNEAFTAGLLHDFGKIVLLHNFPDRAAQLYEETMPTHRKDDEILEMEREAFGFSHTAAGGYLVKRLNFPASIAAVVERHHEYDRTEALTPAMRTMLNIVVMSNRLANTLGYGFNHQINEQAFAEDPIIDILIRDEVFDAREKVILVDEALELRPFVDEYLSEVA